jgi:uncharacterized protein YjbJ (UPF0337 family)
LESNSPVRKDGRSPNQQEYLSWRKNIIWPSEEAGPMAHLLHKKEIDSLFERRIRMNWDSIQGKWKEFKGKIKEKWGKLTDDDLDVIEGKKDQLVGLVQDKYGKTREEAEKEVEEWRESL